MFYLKHNGEKLEISYDNMFTVCPICGKEHRVDLIEVAQISHFDLDGTALYCPQCTAKRRADK